MKKWSQILVISLGLFVAFAAQATLLNYLSLEELSRTSHSITRGRVEAVRTEKESDSGRLHTFVTLRPTETVKGKLAPTITLRQLGGDLDGVSMRVPGTPRFTPGEDVVLFMVEEKGLHFLRGMGQGRFLIRMENGVEMARQDFAGASVVQVKSGRMDADQPPVAPLDLPVVDLFSKVRTAIGTP